MNDSPAPLPADYFGFDDLAALQAAHTRLIRRQGGTPLPADFLDGVGDFIVQAQATGRVLADDEARTTAQTVIDYWVTVLLRGRRTPPETGLAEFGFHVPKASLHETPAAAYLNEERVAIRKRLRLSAAAAQWNDSARDRLLLWGGPELADAAEYSDLTALEKEFIAAGAANVKRTTRVRRRVIAAAVVAAGTIFTLVFGGLIFGYLNERRHTRETNHRLAMTMVERAAVRMGEGDVAGSTAWLAQALREDTAAADPEAQREDRVRLGAALAQLPRLDQLFLEENAGLQTNLARFSSDGKRVLTVANPKGGGPGTARLYDTETGAKLADFPDAEASVNDAGFCADGRVLTVAGDAKSGGRVCFWKLNESVATLPGMHEVVRSATFSPDGKRVALLCESPLQILLHDTADGHALAPPLVWDGAVKKVAFSPDGTRLAACGTGRAKNAEGAEVAQEQVRVWDVASGAEATCGPLNYNLPLGTVAFAPDNRRLVTAASSSDGKTARLEVRDSDTGAAVFTTDLSGQLVTATFSPDGQRVLTANHDATARVFDARTGRPLLEFSHDSSVSSAAYSPDGRFIASGSRDHTARVWSVATGRLALPPLNHGFTVSSVAFSRDGERLLTVAPDGARSWRLRTGEPVAPVLQLNDPVWKTALARDGSRVLAVSRNGAIGRWDLHGGPSLVAPLAALNSPNAIFFSDDANLALIASKTSARVWDTAQRTAVSPPLPLGLALRHAVFSRDHSRVLLAGVRRGETGGSVQLFDTASGTPVGQPLAVQGTVGYAVFSDDGRHVLTASGTTNPPAGEARVWDAATGQPQSPPLTHSEEVTHASFNSTLTRVVTASADDTAKIWDIDLARGTAGEPRVLTEHTADLTLAAFSPDGKYIVTASFDRTAVLWNAAGDRLRVLQHPGAIRDARFDDDGLHLVTACADHAVRVWAVPSGDWISLFPHDGEVSHAFFLPKDASAGLRVVTLSTYEPAQLLREAQRSFSAAGTFDPMREEPAPVTMLRAHVWRLPEETGKIAEVEQFAQLVLSRGIEKNRDLVRLERGALGELWARGKGALFLESKADLATLPPLLAVEESEATGEWFAARWHLNVLLKEPPNDPALLIRRGFASANLREWEQAAADYESAVGRQPESDLLVRKRLARVRIELGEFPQAIERATQALATAPADRNLYMLRAEAYAATARWDEAAADLLKAIELKPKMPSSYARLGTVRLKQNRPDDYVALTRKMVELFGNDEGFASTAAWACSLRPGAAADPEAIVKLARLGIEDDPHSFYPLNTLGAALYRAGHLPEAIAQFAVSRAAYMQAASAAQLRGDADADLMPLQDGRPPDWIFLAMAQFKTGQTAEAREWLKKSGEAVKSKSIRDPRRTWHRIELEILLDEATALISPPPAP